MLLCLNYKANLTVFSVMIYQQPHKSTIYSILTSKTTMKLLVRQQMRRTWWICKTIMTQCLWWKAKCKNCIRGFWFFTKNRCKSVQIMIFSMMSGKNLSKQCCVFSGAAILKWYFVFVLNYMKHLWVVLNKF